MLAGLAGCTEWTWFHSQKNEDYDSFEIYIEADLTEEHPIVFSEIRPVYRFKGNEINQAKAEKAVNLVKTAIVGELC